MPKKRILFLLLLLITVQCILFVTKYFMIDISARSDNSGLIGVKNEKMKQPHILLIIADDLGFNDVGYHGSDINTPNIDWLANTGVRLENYYVQPICTPTRGQLLSGRYQIHTGLQWVLLPADPSGLPLDNPTIADKMKEAGYSTHFVGKWHVGFFKPEYLPTRRGFDTFFGFLSGHSDHFSHNTTQWQRPFMTGYDLLENESPASISKYDGIYSTHLFAERVMDLIRMNEPERPMFIILSFQAVHAPLQVPDSYLNQYRGEVNERRRNYSGMTSCIDEAMGRLVSTMKQHKIWDNTVLIFSTDNGANSKAGGSNRPLKGDKGSYWEGGIRGVGFVHSPLLGSGKMENGYIVKELIHVTDWFPTLVNLAGGSLTNNLDGFDQWGTIKFNSPSPRREILHNINIELMTAMKDGTFNQGVYYGTGKASLRIENMKIVLGYADQRPEKPECNSTAIYLFDITNDPLERSDLSCKFPDVVKMMMERIEFYMSGMVSSKRKNLDPQANPEYHNGFWQPWVL